MTVEQYLWGIAIDLEVALARQLEANGNVDTGYLKGKISVKIEGDNIIISMPYYGKFIEFGTSPHIIMAKNKKVLSDINSPSTKKKNAIFGTVVFHPGTRPSPFVRPVLHQELGKIINKNFKRYLG